MIFNKTHTNRLPDRQVEGGGRVRQRGHHNNERPRHDQPERGQEGGHVLAT